MEVYTKQDIDKLIDPLVSKISELERKINTIDAIQEAWVKTKEAMRITGVSRQTLDRDKVKPGSLIKYCEKDKTYERKSLLEYKNQKSKVLSLDPVEIRNSLLKSA